MDSNYNRNRALGIKVYSTEDNDITTIPVKELKVDLCLSNFFDFGNCPGHIIRSALIKSLADTCGCTKLQCDKCNNQNCVIKHTIISKEPSGRIEMNNVILETNFQTEKGLTDVALNKSFTLKLFGDAIKYSDRLKAAINKMKFITDNSSAEIKSANISEEDYTIEIVPKQNTGDAGDIKENCKIKITFETPYINIENHRNRFTGEINKHDKFAYNNLIRSVTHKVTALYNTCANRKHFDYRHYTEHEYKVHVVESNIVYDLYNRKSTHDSAENKREHKLKGCTGYIIYEGHFRDSLELLKLVEHLHIGKETTMGFGKFRVEKI